MKSFGVILTLLAAAAVPVGATAFNGSVNSSGFYNATGGCGSLMGVTDNTTASNTANGYSLSGDLILSGPGGYGNTNGCAFQLLLDREIAEPGGTSVNTTVSQTATWESTGDWLITSYQIYASLLGGGCNTASVSVNNPASGSFNLGPQSSTSPCLTEQYFTPDKLSSSIYFFAYGAGEGSLTIHFGNSAEFSVTPENAAPEPASMVLIVGGLATGVLVRRRSRT